MAISLQNQSATDPRVHPLVKFYYQLSAPFKRLWWHIHAYSVIFGVMLLAVLSVAMLFIHDRFTDAFSFFQQGWQSSNRQAPEISVSVKQQR